MATAKYLQLTESQPGLEPTTCESQVRCPTNSETASPVITAMMHPRTHSLTDRQAQIQNAPGTVFNGDRGMKRKSNNDNKMYCEQESQRKVTSPSLLGRF